jgi:PAS domain S-box-containing protein
VNQLAIAAIDAAPVAVIAVDADSRVVLWNRAASDLFGYCEADALDRPAWELIAAPETRDEIRLQLSRASSTAEVELTRADGQRIPAELKVQRSQTSGGQALFVAYLHDLTERRASERHLRRSEAQLTEAQRVGRMGSWELDQRSGELSWSKEFYCLHGLAPDEDPDLATIDRVVLPEDRPWFDQIIRNLEQGDHETEGEYRIRSPKSSEVRVIQAHAHVELADDGRRRRITGVCQDVTNRRRAETRERELARLVEHSHDAIVLTDPKGVIRSWNRGAERMFGYTSEEAVGREIEMLDQNETAVEVRETVRRVQRGEVLVREVSRRHKDGHVLEVELAGNAVYGAEGELVGGAVVYRDLSEGRRAREIQRANEAKTEFLSRMSHELRTPLNAVLGFAQLLEGDLQDELQRDNVAQILAAGRHLLGMIDEILEISLIETGRLALEMAPLALDSAAHAALELVGPLCIQRGVQMDVDIPPIGVLADEQRLRQVLINLLSNAIKYNVQGGRVTLNAGQPNGRVQLCVEDTGPGIAPEKLSRLFVPFDRLGAEATSTEGTGLGLAVSKSLVEAMRGSIEVESELGHGTSVSISLEAAPLNGIAQPHGGDDEWRAPAQRTGAAKTVLCVEDDASNRRLIERLVALRPSLRLAHAADAATALELAHELHPDLVLLDVHLPDAPGDQVLRALRESPELSHTRVVIVSADATQTTLSRLTQAGADDYLTKPIDIPQWLRVLDSVLP